MIFDISKLDALVKEGYLRKTEMDNLVLYGYTDHCTFDRHWNEYTKAARGLILEKETGLVVAKPFEKFFNLNEMEETQQNNLPIDQGYEVFDKVDGSLGILFYHKDTWKVATRGSFNSVQAVKGAEILKKYKIGILPNHLTVMAEIIYPENKIIVDYGDQEKLVMLGIIDRQSGEEIDPSIAMMLAKEIGMEFAQPYNYTIEEMIDLQKTLPLEREGFVVRFGGGLRVKIKGAEYLRLAKIISNISPISFWESMKNGKVNTEYLAQLPEEFRGTYEHMVLALENNYKTVMAEILADTWKLPKTDQSKEGRKSLALFLNETKEVKHKSIMFSYAKGQMSSIDQYILDLIRPDGNIIKSF